MDTTLARPTLSAFLLVARLEGVSLLLLLFVAMPIKYGLGEPLLVEWVGLAHGVLFLGYVAALLAVTWDLRWPFGRAALGLFASVVPGGTFLFERSLDRSPS